MTAAQKRAMRRKAVVTEARRLGISLDAEVVQSTPAKTRKPKQWELAPKQRIARYMGQPDFWFGPATPAQIERTGLPAGTLAWQCAEAHNAKQAKAAKLSYKPIRNLTR